MEVNDIIDYTDNDKLSICPKCKRRGEEINYSSGQIEKVYKHKSRYDGVGFTVIDHCTIMRGDTE